MAALFNAGFLGVCFELVPDQEIFFCWDRSDVRKMDSDILITKIVFV